MIAMDFTFRLLMASYIRGFIIKNKISFNKELLEKDLFDLTDDEIDKLTSFGKSNELKLYYFKEKEDLARVTIVLGFLKSIYPKSLLDVGSGRGVFLFPLLREFSYLNITSLDILDKRVDFLDSISKGGVNNLNVIKADITNYSCLDNSYEVVTLLEVLEHIPNVYDAIKNACRIAKDFVVVTVPNKEDNNPEHIHLLTKEKLTNMFNSCGVDNLKFSGVNGHLFMIAKVG